MVCVCEELKIKKKLKKIKTKIGKFSKKVVVAYSSGNKKVVRIQNLTRFFSETYFCLSRYNRNVGSSKNVLKI
jgi:hypothetical protein